MAGPFVVEGVCGNESCRAIVRITVPDETVWPRSYWGSNVPMCPLCSTWALVSPVTVRDPTPAEVEPPPMPLGTIPVGRFRHGCGNCGAPTFGPLCARCKGERP